MPLVGLALGAVLGRLIGSVADYVAIAALIGLGAYLLLENEELEQARLERLARSRGIAMAGAGVAVGLDELAIGFALGLLGVPVVAALILIAVQAFAISQFGFAAGARVSESIREGVGRLAGLALMAVGGLLLAGKFVALPL
jgi:putative Mn2+ efflux pump MntP